MKTTIAILSIMICVTASAQDYFPSLNVDIVPPLPQSSAVMEQQLPQPSLLTGAADFGLPLYTIETNGYTLPLELRYRSNGIKVFDDPGPLGYGWSLLPALRVTRTILGRPDEQSYDRTEELLDRTNALRWKTAYYTVRNSKSATDRFDCMPDIFSIALPDKMLTRIMKTHSDGSRYFVGVGDDEYSVTCEEEEGQISAIRVRDCKGTEYVFSDTYEFSYGDKTQYQYRTAWMLKEIRPPYGESIRFEWSLHDTGRHYSYEGGTVLVDSCTTTPYPKDVENNAYKLYSNYQSVYGQTSGDARLDCIKFTGGSVTFFYAGNKISRIIASQNQNGGESLTTQAVRSVSLSYSGAGFNGHVLTTVNFSDIGSYHFHYDIKTFGLDPKVFPSIYAQDWWGYYNGKDNTTLTPSITIKKHSRNGNPDTSAGWHPAVLKGDRSVDEKCMGANMLRSVTYPGGGRLEYVYEPHRFSATRADDYGEMNTGNPTLDKGGGLRVKSILMYDHGETVPTKYVDYTYANANVRAVPSGATFIEKNAGVTSVQTDEPSREHVYARIVNIMPESNYMRYDIGELPIWYGEVNEVWAEGRKTYTFSQTLVDRNVIKVLYGRRVPVSLSSIFSKGPMLQREEIYDTDGNKLSEERYVYERVSGDTMRYAYITRELISFNPLDDDAPDFTLGINGKELWTMGKTGNRNVLVDYPSEHSYPFGIYPLSIVLQTERQIGHIHKEYASGITHSVIQSTNYKEGTGLPLTVTTAGGGLPTSTVTLTYPSSEGSTLERDMIAGNSVGLPLSETRRQGSCTSISSAEYIRCQSGFVPARIIKWCEGEPDTLQTPRCRYFGNGKIADYIDADGCSATYLYGYSGLYPIAKIEGKKLPEIAALEGSALGGNAENHTLSTVKGVPITRMYYKPLVGLTKIRQPWGTTQTFTYNDDGLLETSGIDSLGTMVRYDYERPSFKPFTTTETRYRNSDGSRKAKTVTQYDGLNRVVSSRDTYYGTTRRYRYDDIGRVSGELLSDGIVNDDVYWTDYAYESSPRALMVSSTKPGEEWKTAGKNVSTQRRPNGNDEPFTCHEFSVDAAGDISCAGLFNPGSVMMEATTDEDGHCVIVAKDRDGNIRLRREGSGTEWLTTYYIYDDFGRLRYVLPPAISPKSYDRTDADLMDFAFRYDYDGAGRMVSSHKPGGGGELNVYTPGGRLLAEWIPAMDDERFRLHLYDRLGREVITGLIKSDGSELTPIIDKACSLGTPDSSEKLLYDISHIDLGADFKPECVRVYDNYAVTSHNFSPDSIAGQSYLTEPMGLLTGILNFYDDGSSHPETYFYDSYGRMIQSISSPGGMGMVQSLSYTYNGEVSTELLRLWGTPTGKRHTLHQHYSYDNTGNMVGHTACLDGQRTAEMSTDYDGFGRVSKQVSGRASRTLEYDDRGWLSRVSTFIKAPSPGSEIVVPVIPGFGSQVAQPYYEASANTAVRPGINLPYMPTMPVKDYSCTEEVFYAAGTHPRYSGTPSAYINTLGGRYDYRYDSFDRLVGADYSSEREGEDFSTEYAYDNIGRPTSVKRWGVVDLDGKDEIFGVVDALTTEYDGAHPRVYSGDSELVEGSNFYGRTGVGTSSAVLTFDDAGRLSVEKMGRTSKNYSYNAMGLPTMISSISGSLARRSTTVRQSHDCQGKLLSRFVTHSTVSTTSKTDTLVDRRYAGPFTFSGDTLFRVDFPGGYFDEHAYPNYLLTDRLGSVDMVVNINGAVVQHNGYYPYGEPWREPTGNHLLFSGKERLRHVVSDSDFGPRLLSTSLCLWKAPDRFSDNTPWLSPYTFCAANPVKFIDPTGDVMMISENASTFNLFQEMYDLQQLTDDKLVFKTMPNGRRRIKIASLGVGNKTYGTRLIRALNSHPGVILIDVNNSTSLISKKNADKYAMKQISGQNGDDRLIVINTNPELRLSVTSFKMDGLNFKLFKSKTPSYIYRPRP